MSSKILTEFRRIVMQSMGRIHKNPGMRRQYPLSRWKTTHLGYGSFMKIPLPDIV